MNPQDQKPVRSLPESPEENGFQQLRRGVIHTFALFRRQRRVFALVSGGVAAVLLLLIFTQAARYESTALMLVKFGRELVYQPEIGSEQSFASRDKQAVINSELAILRSEPVIQAVVATIGVDTLYPSLAAEPVEGDTPKQRARAETLRLAEATARLKAALSTQALPDAEVLQVSFQHEDPIVAADTVNSLLEHFLEAHLRAFSEPEIVDFLTERVAEYESRLAESEQALRNFETEHAAFALDSPQQTLVQSRSDLRAQIEELEAQMATIRLRHLQDDPAVAQARSQLLNLQVDSSELKGDAKQDLESRIRVVRRFIATRKAEVQKELDLFDAKIAPLRRRLAVTEAELARLPVLSAENRRLRRERDGDEEQYRTYHRRLRTARLSGEMDREKIASINIIQQATPSARPAWPPPRGTSAAVAIVLSLLAGALVVTLLDQIGPTGIEWLDGERIEDEAA